MKIALYISLLSLAACTSPEKDVKQLRDNIMRMHDRMMERSALIVKSKLQVDTLQKNMALFKESMPTLDTIQEKAQLKTLGDRLQAADDRMSDWMSSFDPMQKGKNTAEQKKYLENEQAELTLMNRTFDTVLTQSEKHLQKFRKK